MNDLARCLYEFVRDKRMRSLLDDEEYREMAHDVELQEERVCAYLDEEQRKELRWLVEAIAFRDSIENEHTFQAALSLARELNSLV